MLTKRLGFFVEKSSKKISETFSLYLVLPSCQLDRPDQIFSDNVEPFFHPFEPPFKS